MARPNGKRTDIDGAPDSRARASSAPKPERRVVVCRRHCSPPTTDVPNNQRQTVEGKPHSHVVQLCQQSLCFMQPSHAFSLSLTATQVVMSLFDMISGQTSCPFFFSNAAPFLPLREIHTRTQGTDGTNRMAFLVHQSFGCLVGNSDSQSMSLKSSEDHTIRHLARQSAMARECRTVVRFSARWFWLHQISAVRENAATLYADFP